MPTNDFKPFATAGGANVSTQAEYLALAALSTGWQSGKASSKEVNKAVRQATFIAAALAQFVSDKGAVDVLDDGNLAGFGTNLIAAMNKTSQPLDATLTALAALVGAANKLPYFNGADTAALTDLTQVGRDIIGKNATADVLTYLGTEQIIPFGGKTQYVDNTTSRMSDVIYTNTYKKAMLVCIAFIIGANNAYMDVTVDSVIVCRVGTTSSLGLRIPVTFVVPPGKTYKAQWVGNNSAVASWVEIV